MRKREAAFFSFLLLLLFFILHPSSFILLKQERPDVETIIGIDLGTTNSEVALVRDGQPHVFEQDGDPILPSFVGLSEDGRLLVGKAAKNQYVLAPERTIKSIKRKMGQDIKVQLGDQEYRPQEISAMILRTLRDRAARELGVAVNKAVITV